MLGHAQLVRGEIPAAVKLLHEALAGAEKHSITTGLRAASCFALAEAHAKLGQPDAAKDAITEARQCVPADYLFMQTGLAVASGWALAASGCLTDAVAVVRAAGEDARKRRQPTYELACVQVAAQWGDTSGATRARELANELSFPLADAVARHTESLLADDAEGLLAASADYAALADRVAAADVAAQAAVAFSRDGTTLAAARADGTVELWDPTTRKQRPGSPFPGQSGFAIALAFGPGHQLASGGTDANLRLWDTATGTPTAAPLARSDTVTGVAITPDGRLAASTTLDGTMLLSPAIADPGQLCDKLVANMSHKQWHDWVSPGIGYITVCPGVPVAPD